MTNIDTRAIGSASESALLEKIYFDATQTIRHYDIERAGFVRIIISIITVLFGFAASLARDKIGITAVYFCFAWVFILSIFGAVVCQKYKGLIAHQRIRAITAMKKIDSLSGSSSLLNMEREIDKSYASSDGFYARLRLSHCWLLLFLISAAMGVIGILLR